MMMVPIPAAVTDAVMIVNGVCESDPDIGAERADMRAGADALATGTRAGADRAIALATARSCQQPDRPVLLAIA